MKTQLASKVAVSTLALLGLGTHVARPDLKIDSISLGLLLLALLPWLSSIIKSVDMPGLGKIEFQQAPDPEAALPSKQSTRRSPSLDESGFYSHDGLTQLIEDSGLVEAGEHVAQRLLLFRTRKQRTWLLATRRTVFCVLDDDKTRVTGRLIQWRLPIDDLAPVVAHRTPAGSRVVTLGPQGNWLYSLALHPDEAELERDIGRMLAEARRSAT